MRFRVGGLKNGDPVAKKKKDWNTWLQTIELEDIEPGARLRVESPLPCVGMSLRIEGCDARQYRSTPRDSATFSLASFYDSIKRSNQPVLHIFLDLYVENSDTISLPVLAVKKGWVVENLEYRVIKKKDGDWLRLSWSEGDNRNMGEIVLVKGARPWEEPTRIEVEPGKYGCDIRFPCGKATPGRYSLHFSLIDEWCMSPGGLPFQKRPQGSGYPIEVSGTRIASSHDPKDLTSRLEEGTDYLQKCRRGLIPRRRPLTLDFPILDDTRAEEVKNALVALLYWRLYLQRKGIPHTKLIAALKEWAESGGHHNDMDDIFDELVEVGGKVIARELQGLRILLYPEAFKSPFNNGDLLKREKKRQIKFYEYLGTEKKEADGTSKRRLKLKNLKDDCIHYFPLDDAEFFVPANAYEVGRVLNKRRRGRKGKR